MTSPLSDWTTLDTGTDTLQLRQQDLTDLLNTSPLLTGWTLVSGLARVTATTARIDAVFVRQQQFSRFRYRLFPGGSTAGLELTAPPVPARAALPGSEAPSAAAARHRLTGVGRSPDQTEQIFRIERT